MHFDEPIDLTHLHKILEQEYEDVEPAEDGEVDEVDKGQYTSFLIRRTLVRIPGARSAHIRPITVTPFQISLQVNVEKNFGQSATKIIEKAFKIQFKGKRSVCIPDLSSIKDSEKPGWPRDDKQWPYDGIGIHGLKGSQKSKIVFAWLDAFFKLGGKHRHVFINSFSKEPDGKGVWTLGSANVSQFSKDKHVRLRLNRRAFAEDSFKSPATWRLLIMHEALHTLGWEHPNFGDDGYFNTWLLRTEKCLAEQTDDEPLSLLLNEHIR